MVVDGERLLGGVVRDPQGTERRIGREVRRLHEAEPVREERPVVLARHGEHVRDSRHAAVRAVARDRDPVGALERRDDLLDLRARVGVVHVEDRPGVVLHLVNGIGKRQAVVPVFVRDANRRPDVLEHPLRRGGARNGPPVDGGERETEEQGAGDGDRGKRLREAARGAAGAFPLRERGEHHGGEDRERGVRRVEVADVLRARGRVVPEHDQRVKPEEEDAVVPPLPGADGSPDERDDGGDTEEDAGAPEDEVAEGEQRSASRPLDLGGNP